MTDTFERDLIAHLNRFKPAPLPAHEQFIRNNNPLNAATIKAREMVEWVLCQRANHDKSR